MVSLTPAMKAYLRAIHSLEKSKVWVRTTELAEAFGVSPASVTEMIQKMAAEGLLNYAPYQGAKLSVRGRKIVMQILRKHRLLEKLLVDFLGLDAPTACNEASKLELIVTNKVVNSICKAFNHPTVCPCGEPIFSSHDCCGG
jgi:DtxR family Mn-dependent transcriptional regulator